MNINIYIYIYVINLYLICFESDINCSKLYVLFELLTYLIQWNVKEYNIYIYVYICA